MSKKQETYISNLESAIAIIAEAIKYDSFDYTKQFWPTFIATAKDYLDKAEKIIT